MVNTMNKMTTMMHQVSQRRSSLLQRSRCCLSSSQIAGDETSTRKRRIAVSPRCYYSVSDQRRSFGSTMMASLAYPSSSPSSLLLPPTIIYSDNHLLAVNKPAGWHSVPNIPKKQKKDDNNRTDNSKGGDTTTTTNNRTPIGGSKKCLLTHLQKKGLGGGSNKDFLVPLHRIDQPCTGVLLFGKTSKAASRVTKVWKGKKRKKKNITKEQEETGNKKSDNDSRNIARGVVKDYLCVVPTSRLSAMEEASASPPASVTTISGDDGSTDSPEFPSSVKHSLADGTQWNQLDGLMLRQSAFSSEHGSSDGGSRPRQRQLQRKQQQQYYNERLKKGRSVKIVKRHNNPGDFYDYDHDVDQKTMRPVNAIWKIVHVPTIDPAYTLLLVRTSEGARHMVRALLAQVGDCPIVGDVRYWKAGRKHDYDDNDDDHENKKKGPLKDRSVALHAYGLYFDKKQLQLGSLDTFEFRAPVPSTWKSFFGIDNHQLQNIL